VDKRIVLILQIALDTPLRHVFDYLPPVDGSGEAPKPGVRVRVPFGRRQLIGVLVGIAQGSRVPFAKLKAALEIMDEEPVFDPVTFELLRWAADARVAFEFICQANSDWFFVPSDCFDFSRTWAQAARRFWFVS